MIIPAVIAADKTLQVPAKGYGFRVYASPVPLTIRTSLDSFNQYDQQTGIYYRGKTFSLLEIQNNSANTIVAQIFVDLDGDLIDNRLLPSPSQPAVAVTSQLTVLTTPFAASLTINDKSGTLITDAGGNKFFAVQRLSCTIFNSSFNVNGSSNAVPARLYLNWTNNPVSGPQISIGGIYSNVAGSANPTIGQPFVFNVAGTFYINSNTGNDTYSEVYCQVVETYQAIFAPGTTSV